VPTKKKFANVVVIVSPELAMQFVEEFQRMSEEIEASWSSPYSCIKD